MIRPRLGISLQRLTYPCVLLGLVLLAACAGGEERIGGLTPPPPKGSLAVSILGLEPGAAANVLVTGPGGFQQQLTTSSTLPNLQPGSYLITSSDVVAGGHLWVSNTPQQVVNVVGGQPAAAEVSYGLTTGALSVQASGLPEGVPSGLTLSGPGGFSQPVTAASFVGLAPGQYSLTGSTVVVGSAQYQPTLPSGPVVVTPGTTPVVVTVAFVRLTGSLGFQAVGLPPGVAASVTVTGPGGFNTTATTADVLSQLDPGSYTVTLSPVQHLGHTWSPNPVSHSATVTATALTVVLPFAISTGGLTVAVTGLPPGTEAQVTVTGPAGFTGSMTATSALVGLTPGNYGIAAASVIVGGQTWLATPANQTQTVMAGTTPSLVTISYGPTQGSLTVTVGGLPGGLNGAVLVTGPGGFSQNLTASTVLTGLQAGNYAIAATSVSSGGQTWLPSPPAQVVTVIAGATTSATVSYGPTTGSLSVTISGLPGGATAILSVTGPGGFSQNLTTTTTLVGLAPGGYTVTASAVSFGGQTWSPTPALQSPAVSAGSTTSVSVGYTQTTGSLSVTISGLPGGASAAVAVTGPGGFNQNLTGTTTLTGLPPGSYTIAAANVSSGGQTYGGTPATQNAAASAGTTVAVSVAYAVTGPATTLNLRIDGVYLTQAIQRYDGTTPLVAGRDAYLRVFALANEANGSTPSVRVRLYNGVTLVQTYTITAPSGSVPLAATDNVLASSWNVLVPGSLVQPNLRVLADVDPTGIVAELNETDNSFPVSGASGPVDVRALPTFNVRFVPVLQSVNGLEGVVNAGNTETFLSETKKMLPIAGYSADLRATYTTSAPALESSNGNGAWGTILSEVLALKSTDGSSRYYYGVVKTTYTSGVAGIGYVGGGARTSLGWDRLPSGSGVMAHELGHNMGRSHAPCGGAGGPDPSFPYAGGKIGVWGLDVATLAAKDPATYVDLMGYCSPDWISDYNWSAIITYRQAGPNNIVAVGQGTGRGLLVWGRITDQGPVLEPAFVVDAPIAIPAPGPHRLEALAADGRVLSTRNFSAVPIGDLPTGREEGFAFVIPIERAMDLEMTSLRIVSGGRTAVQRTTGPLVDPSFDLSRDASGRTVLRWDRNAYPMVLVQDAATGAILSFARGGEVRLPVTRDRLRLSASDGVRTRTEDRIFR